MSNRHPKLKGLRLGQVVYNAIAHGGGIIYDYYEAKAVVAETLYYIEDEDLVKLINDYLKEQ